MKSGTIYDKLTGRVIMTVEAPDEDGVLLQVIDSDTQAALMNEQLDSKSFYVKSGEKADRPLMSLRAKVDGSSVNIGESIQLPVGSILSVDNIEKGSVVLHPGGETKIDDGFIEWSALEPGVYFFEISNFPFQEVRFNAVVG